MNRLEQKQIALWVEMKKHGLKNIDFKLLPQY
jgi:hypothetical protein